ncbi:MAG: hypothetical protein RQ745_06290, partial [Longimicrobiales bacterium]|nr:hypothetical protein [Longimicrobiales bacterium]
PLRAVLILLEAGIPDPRAATLVLRYDSEWDGPNPDETGGADDASPGAHLDALADPEGRLEHLVSSPAWVVSGWLAERLDHLRHIHLWAGPERTREALERARLEEAPLATRLGGRLDRALADWLEKAVRYRLVERATVRAPGESGDGRPDAPAGLADAAKGSLSTAPESGR